MNKLLNIIANIRVNRAIRKAERLHKQTRYNYIVINYNKKPVVMMRKELKNLVAKKFFKDGKRVLSIEFLERTSIYKTY